MFCFIILCFYLFACNRLTSFSYIYIYIAVGRPSLSKFHYDHIHRAHLHADRSFHSLVTLQRLAIWELGPEPSIEALAHELTVRRRESFFYYFFFMYT